MKWGTYRPQVFFGMKTRSTRPMITGLMWTHAHSSLQENQMMRHASEMDPNISYGWNRHDGRSFGKQEIVDRSNKLRLTTEMIKQWGENTLEATAAAQSEELSKGGDWAVRLTGKSLSSQQQQQQQAEERPWISLFYYFAFESSEENESDGSSSIRISGVDGMKRGGLSNPVLLTGESEDLGAFSIYIKDNSATNKISLTGDENNGPSDDIATPFHFVGLKKSPKDVWKVKDFAQDLLRRDYAEKRRDLLKKARNPEEQVSALSKRLYATLPNFMEEDSNIVVIQKIVRAPFQIDIALLSDEMHSDLYSLSEIVDAGDALVNQFKQLMDERQNRFENQFDHTFNFKKFSMAQRDLAMFGLSNMIGSLGYFYGNSYHKYGNNQPVVVPPYSLFTGVPARSFFPRGFLWDEGFHLLLTQRWDKEISKDIISHWLRTMSKEGWIPREQILGDEARSRVPQEFQVQHDTHANPPMIFLTILNLIRNVQEKQRLLDKDMETSPDVGGIQIRLQSESIESDKQFLKEAYPLLMRNYNWIVQTQKGQKPNSYRWRGRTPGHTLASGLDDYPRGNDEPQDSERHLDLYCWVFMMTNVIQELRSVLQIDTDKMDMGTRLSAMRNDFNKLHWNNAIHWYSDYAGTPGVNETRNEFSDHIGYVSLFPFLFDLVTVESDEFDTVMNYIHNKSYMWTNYGLRSLSASDPLAGTKEDYWRGPIWMNINYLTLRALHRNAIRDEPTASERIRKNMQTAKQIYNELRNNLLTTLTNNWKVSKTLHEQYNPVTGSGQRAFPFTGWTALITLIFGELY